VPGAPPIDLIGIDLDGTLLNSKGELSAQNREALHRCHELGVKVVLCTGRAYAETRPVIDQIGLDLDAAVTAFGSIITEVATGRTLRREAICRTLTRRATDWFRREGYAVFWLTDREQCGFDGFVINGPRRHPAVDNYVRWTPCELRSVEDAPVDHPDLVRISALDDTPVLDELSVRFDIEFGALLVHNVLRAPSQSLSIIETFAPKVSKWQGILHVCQTWGIPPERTAGIGDDVNDLEMLRNAGFGIAMANANPKVLNEIALRTASNDENGVAAAIHRLLSGELSDREQP
jgi:hypothetical protein